MKSVADILEDVKSGIVSPRRAERLLKLDAIGVVGDVARIDFNRYLRRGVPEIVYAKSKTHKQLSAIVTRLVKRAIASPELDHPIIISRVNDDQVNDTRRLVESLQTSKNKLAFRYFQDAHLIAILPPRKHADIERRKNGKVALIAAGTSDLPALSEAEAILEIFGCETTKFTDVGVAALHRLRDPLKQVFKFDPDVIIVAAGMEGALPSLIAGLSDVPVIGLPTSVGYGYGAKGEAALMSMLQACPLGITVVNIDGGVGAGVSA